MLEAYEVMVLGKRLKPKDCTEIWYNQQCLLGWPPYELKVGEYSYAKKEDAEQGEIDLWKGQDL